MAGRSEDSAYDVLFAAPEMLSSPGLSASAMVTTDPSTAAQTMSYTDTLSAVDEHAEQHKGHFGFIPGWIKKPGGKALQALAAPLHEVQHDYRFIHDVFERQGIGQGLLALGAVGTGAAAGGFVGGATTFGLGTEAGAVLGGEGAASLLGRFGGSSYEESFRRTADGENYRGANGNLVSPGRDLATLIDYIVPGGPGFKQDSRKDSLISGTFDAIFDLTFDPLMLGGKVNAARQGAKFGAHGEAATANLYKTDAAGHVLDELGYRAGTTNAAPALARPGIGDATMPADRVLDLYNTQPRFAQMVDILSKKSTEDILRDHPKLFGLAKELGEASSHDDVLNVFRDAITAHNYSVLSSGLPRTGLTAHALSRAGLIDADNMTGATLRTKAKNAILNAGSKEALTREGAPIDTVITGPNGEVADVVPNFRPNKVVRTFTSYRPWNISSDLHSLSAKHFNPADESAAKTVNQILRISQNKRTADAITANFMHATDLGQRTNIYVNAVTDMMRTFGIHENAEILTKWKSDMQQMLDSSSSGYYGLDRDGNRLLFHDPVTGEAVHSGIMHNQVGSFAMPDFNAMRQAFREDRSFLRRVNGKLDDWTYQFYTSRFFKPLALLSLGFAARVAGGELLPAAIRYGRDLGKGALASAAIRLNPTLGEMADNLDQDTLGKLVGLRVGHASIADGVGTIKWVDKGREGGPAAGVLIQGRPKVGLPEGYTMQEFHDPEHRGISTLKVYHPSEKSSVAHLHFLNSPRAGEDNGQILEVLTNPEHQRKGLATAMFDRAQEIAPDLHHNPILSEDGKKWVRALNSKQQQEVVLPLDELDAYHHPIDEKDIRLIAKGAGIKLQQAEVPHVKAAVQKAIYGVSHALVDEDYLRTAYLNVLHNDGHIVAPALAADHGESRIMAGRNSIIDALDRIGKTLPQGKQLGDKWGVFDGNDELHPLYWQNAIHEAANDMSKGAQAYAAAKRAGQSDDEALAAFIREDKKHVALNPKLYKERLAGYRVAGPDEFSRVRGLHFQGLVSGKGDTYHDFVADAIANGDAPSLYQLEDVDIAARPRVKGRLLENVPASQSGLSKITNYGFRRFLQPTINMLAREPIFTTAVTHEYKALKPHVDAGVFTEAEANWIAQQRAVPQVLPLIHNTHLRSQFAEGLRNHLPFYYAQEQAYRRYATAFLHDPVSFERARLMLHGIHGSGIIQEDDAGNSYIVFPGLGGGTDHLAGALSGLGLPFVGGIPNQVSGNVSSLKSVVPGGLVGLPEGPGVSPLMAIALKDIQNFFPPSEPVISEVLGPIAQSQDWKDSLIPNSTLRNVVQAMGLREGSRQFQSAFLYAIQNAKRRSDELRAQGKTDQADALFPDANADPQVRQRAINRIRNTTRLMFLVRAGFSATLPMSPKIELGDIGLREEVRQSIAKRGDFALGLQDFLDAHPDATADTVFQTDSRYTGTKVPHGHQAVEWLREHRGFAQSNTLAAAYLIPQDTSEVTDPQSYNLELAMGLARRKTPEDFVNALYAASGDAVYYPSLKKRDETIAANPSMEQEIRSQFAQWKNQLAFSNPIWFKDMEDPTRQATAHFALLQLRDAINSGKAPASPQLPHIQQLIADYDKYVLAQQIMRARGQAVTSITDQWEAYLDQYAKDHPVATAVINGIFRRLPTYERFGNTNTEVA